MLSNIPKKSITNFFKEVGLLLLFCLLFIVSLICFKANFSNNDYSGEVGGHLLFYGLSHAHIFCLLYLGIILLLSFVNTNYKIPIKIAAIFLLNLLIIPFFLLGETGVNSIYLALLISTFISFAICFCIYYLFASKPSN